MKSRGLFLFSIFLLLIVFPTRTDSDYVINLDVKAIFFPSNATEPLNIKLKTDLYGRFAVKIRIDFHIEGLALAYVRLEINGDESSAPLREETSLKLVATLRGVEEITVRLIGYLSDTVALNRMELILSSQEHAFSPVPLIVFIAPLLGTLLSDSLKRRKIVVAED